MTTTLVPSGANSHRAMRVRRASGGCSRATAACRAGRPSAPARRRRPGCRGSRSRRRSPWAKRTKYFIVPESSIPQACCGARVDRVGAGVEVVGEAAGDQVGARTTVAAASTSHTRCRPSLKTTRRPVAGVGRAAVVVGGRLVDLRLGSACRRRAGSAGSVLAAWSDGLGSGAGAAGRRPRESDRATAPAVGRRRQRAGAAEHRDEGDRRARSPAHADPAVARPDRVAWR